MDYLNGTYLNGKQHPERVIQIGEGRFLRGFVDWLIHQLNVHGYFNGSVVVVAPRPSGQKAICTWNRQNSLYTVITRGIISCQKIDQAEIITSVSRAIDPHVDWASFISCAENQDMKVLVSNTTEAGLSYIPEEWHPTTPMSSFPAKVTAYLYHRYVHFEGSPSSGMIIVPCELVSRNGDLLRSLVCTHATEWKLDRSFVEWVQDYNVFCNTLVDRIVPGTPAPDSRRKLETRLGYHDELLTVVEPYYFWAIDHAASLARLWPFERLGMNVHYVDDVAFFHKRKLYLLNILHTIFVGLARFKNLHVVRDVVNDAVYSRFIEKLVHTELIPTLSHPEGRFRMPAEDLKLYFTTVVDRFSNPFIDHTIRSIALNGISKIRERVIPVLLEYVRMFHDIPPMLTMALASLLMFYQDVAKGVVSVDDDPSQLSSIMEVDQYSLEAAVETMLSSRQFWGSDLRSVSGLQEGITQTIRGIDEVGVDRYCSRYL